MSFRNIVMSLAVMLAPAGAFASAQQQDHLRFAFLTDTHIAVGSQSINDLSACIRDINAYDSLDFVIFGGDITNFGSDEEIRLAKSMTDSIRRPVYVVQGNHDANWSESGCGTFKEVFGYERFLFRAGGWRFIGCNSGPDMRMAPGLVPRETMEWLSGLESGEKTIFINHYPMDSSVLNYFDVTRELKRLDTRMVIGGHLHANRVKNYQGIPAVVCRSALSAGKTPGYTVVRIDGDRISFSERRLYGQTAVELEPWASFGLAPVKDTVRYDAHGLPSDYPWMRYDVNDEFPQVREVWKKNYGANIAAGFACSKDKAFFPLASGSMLAVSLKDGLVKWKVEFPGKIYSTPALSGKYLVFGCSDGNIYALNASDGSLKWSFKTGKAVLASPVVMDGKVYAGGSDGAFRCIDLKSGKTIWTYDNVEGHAVSTPYASRERVMFGTWGGKLYSLDPVTGREHWVWSVGKASKMYSPASTLPLYSSGRVFVAVPDRQVYAIDAVTGRQLFRVKGGRDAICLGSDGRTVYSKEMFGKAYAFPSDVAEPSGPMLPDACKTWVADNHAGYDIAPTALSEKDGVLYIPTDKGNIIALRASDGTFLWAHKLSTALINPLRHLTFAGKNAILASAMDGTVALMML